jgi:hypothetical protein
MSYVDKRPATIFCDIDGTLVVHASPTDAQLPTHKLDLLEGTIEKLLEWDALGYGIILTTGRRESLRKVTEEQLAEAGIIYDQLIMGIGGGKRYLINDRKPDDAENYSIAINLKRNKGIKDLKI